MTESQRKEIIIRKIIARLDNLSIALLDKIYNMIHT